MFSTNLAAKYWSNLFLGKILQANSVKSLLYYGFLLDLIPIDKNLFVLIFSHLAIFSLPIVKKRFVALNMDINDKDIVICRILKYCLLMITLMTVTPSLAMQIITHKSVQVTSMNTTQLRRIYTMRQQRWGNDVPIVVYVLPSQHQLHMQFSKDMLKIFPYKLDRIWNKLTFSGLGVAPRVAQSPQELIHLVSSTPGAIGYIDKVNKDEHVNVVEISK